MTLAPELTDLEALSNEQRLVEYRARRIEHDIDADIDGYAMTAYRVNGVKVGRTSLAHALDELEILLESYNRSRQASASVPFDN